MTGRLYQVWDWKKCDVQSYHLDRQSAIDEAARLNRRKKDAS